jgi:hypothetical protein
MLKKCCVSQVFFNIAANIVEWYRSLKKVENHCTIPLHTFLKRLSSDQSYCDSYSDESVDFAVI